MPDMSRLTVRIPESLRRDLQRLSRESHLSASEIVREALRRYTASNRLRHIRSKTRRRAEARGFLTDDDVFKAVS
jgi:metal-responsive CopG/Arc/MetJ family transcriptional regulator